MWGVVDLEVQAFPRYRSNTEPFLGLHDNLSSHLREYMRSLILTAR